MELTVSLLNDITGNSAFADRKASYIDRLKDVGGDFINAAVFAQINAQVMKESGSFKYVEEIASGKAYEGRKDLGNTRKGDGVRYKGRDLVQCTGRFNYGKLSKWAGVDFLNHPELLTDHKYLGLSVIWYFSTRNGLLQYCKDGNNEMVTRRVNGGLNHYAERLRYYDQTALSILGYETIAQAQKALGVKVDGVSGPVTRKAMHKALSKITFKDAKPTLSWVDLILKLLGLKK